MSNTRDDNPEWWEDRRGLSAERVLDRLADLLAVPTPPNSTWRAATVTMFATDPLGVSSAYHQHVQDITWPIAEQVLIEHAIEFLHRRSRGARA